MKGVSSYIPKKHDFNDIKVAVNEYVNSNKSITEIAEKNNLNFGTLRNWIIKLGFFPRGRHEARVDEKREKECCRLYLKGKTNKELRIKYGVSRRTVFDWLKKNGIKSKTFSETMGVSQEKKDKAIKMYSEENLNCCEIGKILDVSNRSVLEWVDGIKKSQSEIMSTVVFKKGSVNIRGKKGSVDTRFGKIYFSSSYEESRIMQLNCDATVKNLSRCNDMIPYLDEGVTRRYNPDFKVEYLNGKIVVEEVKPFVMINKVNNRIKFRSAQLYYKPKNIIYKVVTESVIYKKVA